MPHRTGGFFQVDGEIWEGVLSLGMNAAVAYLVLACGTGRDNRTTRWSVNAIEKYTGISRSRAHKAIQALARKSFINIEKSKRSERSPPTYWLLNTAEIGNSEASEEPDWIWLPNELITGAAGEIPPVERIRQTQNFHALELLVRLYAEQNIADDGGLHWELASRVYTQKKITERGIWAIIGASSKPGDRSDERWKFLRESQISSNFTVIDEDTPTPSGANHFTCAFEALRAMGLIECIPYVLEGPTEDAELVFPSDPKAGTTVEMEVACSANRAAEELLGQTAKWQLEPYDIVIPVPKSMSAAIVVGIYRLRYRLKTKMTAAWQAKQLKLVEWVHVFEELACTGDALIAPPARRR